jgi:hypothetical protein
VPRSFRKLVEPLAVSLPALMAAGGAPQPCIAQGPANCQYRTCRDRDPCRHHSPFVREMRCTCRDCVPPLGTKLYSMMDRQIANGTASRLVLYHYDFLPRDARLSHRGLRQLRKIVRMMAQSTSPLIIQATPGQPELDERRRQHVAAQSSKLSMPLPLERVIVAPSPTHGLDGIDAVINHDQLLHLMKSGGASSGAGIMGGGAASGIGAGGAASGIGIGGSTGGSSGSGANDGLR